MSAWAENAGLGGTTPIPGALGGNDDTFRAIAEAVPGMLWICAPDGRTHYVSPRWLDYGGTNFQPTAGNVALNLLHPDDVLQAQAAWKQAVENGKTSEIELRLRRHDGAYRWHRVRGVPERDPQGGTKGWVVVCIDIEEQKQNQQEAAVLHETLTRSKEELERTVEERTHELQEVVEQLEAFAYSIAHDMRAPLRTMHQYAETVSRDFATRVPEEARVYLNKIMGAAEKLDLLIREVLVYTRVSQGRIEMQSIDLGRILSDILISHPQLNSPAVELNARAPLHAVVGDETGLTQALSNLLTNAAKFTPRGRKPEVDLWTEQIGDHVRICVKDNGIGIAPGDQKRIFKMFERLQPEAKYEGSGIGLTIVRRAVERMGGNLGVESVEGQGSTFWIELKKGESC